jgi:hypothetical protein
LNCVRASWRWRSPRRRTRLKRGGSRERRGCGADAGVAVGIDPGRGAAGRQEDVAASRSGRELAPSSRPATAEFTSVSDGKHSPELAAIAPPSARQRRPRAYGSVGPDQRATAANGPPSSSVIRTLSTRGRDLPPRDPPPSVHPDAGREGEDHLGERRDSIAALVPLARAAAKAFSDQNGVVDVNHAVRRLADAKAQYGMSDNELEKYVRAAPEQPGVLRARFPFSAAFSPGRLEPWLERHRQRRVASVPSGAADDCGLPVHELAIRGSAFLASLHSSTGHRG